MIFESPYPPVEIPEKSLSEWFLERIEPFGEKPALIDAASGRQYSFAQLGGAIRAVAGNLAARGLAKGDVLAILSPNIPEYAMALHGTTLAGGVVTTANPLYTVDELAHQLRDAGARYLVTIPMFLDNARAAAEQAGTVEEIFVFGEGEGATPFAALLAPGASPPEVRIEPDDLVYLPYSSGTTGVPKGVMLTHRNIVANLAQTEGVPAENVAGPEDTVIGVLPFFHIYGLVIILNFSLMRGATVVSLPRFDLEQFLEALQRYRVTLGNVVPPILLALAKHPAVERYDLGALRSLGSGAAPLGEELASAAARRLGCSVTQGYGLTETSPVTHARPSELGTEKISSVGPAIPNTEVRIIDVETGAELGPDETGEVLIRGPQVMKGYLNQPEITRQTIDEEGWLHTGDVGYVDEDGFLWIVDRVKELIKYKGFQVAPAELEALLLGHPGVADVAVIPSPDEESGEIPKALVVPAGEPVDPETLMAWVAERVAPHKKIRALEYVESIPKAASGKILRRVLVERERERERASGAG